MTKEQLIALGLTEELAVKAATASSEELKGYVPKTDYTTLENTNTTLTGQLGSIETLVKALVKDAKGSTLEEQVNSFQQSIQTEKGNMEKQLQDLKFEHSLEKALLSAKAKNPTAVKALLKKDNLKMNADGSVVGLEEQLKAIQESDAYLFGEVEEAAGGTGGSANRARKNPPAGESIGERLAKQAAVTAPESPYFKN